MLADDGLRIYTDDFAVGEGELNLLACLLVLFRLIVGGINHRLPNEVAFIKKLGKG